MLSLCGWKRLIVVCNIKSSYRKKPSLSLLCQFSNILSFLPFFVGLWLCSQWHRVPVHSYQCPSLFYILSSHHHISAGLLGLAQCHGQCHHLHLTLLVLVLVKKKGFHLTFSFSLRSKSSSRLREMEMSLCQRCMMVKNWVLLISVRRNLYNKSFFSNVELTST